MFIALVVVCQTVHGQKEHPHLLIKSIDQEIVIDGLDNEPVWKEAPIGGGFWQMFPTDTLKAVEKTQFRLLSDDKHLYVYVEAYGSQTDLKIRSLKRDFSGRGVDNVTLMLDPFSDSTNGIFIGSNPYSVQREGQVSNGGQSGLDLKYSWDIIWEVKSTISDDKYSVEFKIPLSQIKYPENTSTWRFNLYRFNTVTNEWTTWAPIPQEFFPINMAFMGTIEFEKPFAKSNPPIYIIPFVNGISSSDFTFDGADNQVSQDLNFGLDGKISITNGLNLDLTINPDFSQVEVDDEIVNLTRFEVSLPEKRQFFIQNEDLFSDYGNLMDSRPFFSRRIGIAEDKNGDNIENPIIGGFRLNGSLNSSTRLGLLNVQTSEDIENEIPSNNNTVFVLQKQVFSRSNFSVLFINRETFKDYEFISQQDRYNRILGLDYKLASSDNSWTGDFFFHQSFAHQNDHDNASFGARLNRQTRNWSYRLAGVYVGEDYRADLGFVRRTGVYRFFPDLGYTFYPKKSSINSISLEQNLFFTYQRDNGSFRSGDRNYLTQLELEFNNTSSVEVEYWNRYTYLFEPFDPTGNDNTELPAFKDYYYSYISLEYASDLSRKFFYEVETELGQFYNGHKYSFESEFRLRVQPKFISSLVFNIDHIDLPDPYPTETISLVSSKFEFTFSRNLFWSTFIQYNSQGKDFGINSRLQWRFAPLSDLYIVYNDNYKNNGFFDNTPQLRSINLKLTYWLSI